MRNCWHWRPERRAASVELCGMKCIGLTKNSVKILGIHFSYNLKIENEENFINRIKKFKNVLKIWKTRTVTVQGENRTFKTRAISTVIHLALTTN